MDRVVEIPIQAAALGGELTVPANACGIVVFAHGSGSSRFSPRNRLVASRLNEAGLGTLLFDLLTEPESKHRANVFDIPLLTDRLTTAVDWLVRRPEVRGIGIGLFGASTGAGAALSAAAMRPEIVRAVVSRGGRPDLAGAALKSVRAATLLIVGGDDWQVIELNRQAFGQLTGRKQLVIVPGAGHLFEEPGKLDEVAQLAADWFARQLPIGEPAPAGALRA